MLHDGARTGVEQKYCDSFWYGAVNAFLDREADLIQAEDSSPLQVGTVSDMHPPGRCGTVSEAAPPGRDRMYLTRMPHAVVGTVSEAASPSGQEAYLPCPSARRNRAGRI
jgi:hypothetical protein